MHMNRKSLATVLTSVCLAVIGFGSGTQAQHMLPGAPALSLPNASQAQSDAILAAISKLALLNYVSPTMQNCRKHNADLNKAIAELSKPCGALKSSFAAIDKVLGVKADNNFGPNSPYYCVAQIARCGACTEGAKSLSFAGKQLDCGTTPDAEDDSDDRSATNAAVSALAGFSRGSTGSASLKRLKDDFEAQRSELLACLPGSGDDADDFKRDLRESREKVDDFEERLQKKQEELQKLQQSQVDSQNSLTDRADEVNSKLTSVLEEIDNLKDKQEGETQSAVVQAQHDIDSIGAEIKRLLRSRDDAYNAYADKVSELDSQCHASALAQVQNYQKEVFAQISHSEFSGGDFNGVLTRAGTTMKQKFQEMALKQFQACKQDASYSMAVKSRTRARDAAVDKTNDEIQNLMKKQADIISQVNQIKTTGQAKSLTALQKKISSLGTQAQKQFDRINREAQAASQKSSRDLMSLTAQINSIAEKSAVARLTYDNDSQLLRLKRMGGKKGAFGEAQAAYLNLRSAAANVVSSCCSYEPDPDSGANGKNEKIEADTSCNTACNPLGVGSGGQFFCKSGASGKNLFVDPGSAK